VAFTGDNVLLRQMIGNLLDNAIRHSKTGGTVAVTLNTTAEGHSILIADEGEGIPQGQQERIFERFVRLDARSDGAGLGLPIARWIVQAHCGTLVLESSDPQGSRFRVTLPSA
jgi:signal transduction histidine kinase